MEIPLFPLQTVLYPGGPLPLRIFEQRYLDMVSRCLKEDCPFGVLQIRKGSETGDAQTYQMGTLARISDWYQGNDGLLGITATGEQRFELLSSAQQTDGLQTGIVKTIPDDEHVALPEDYSELARILRDVLADLGRLYENVQGDAADRYLDDAGWVANRFAEVLPISPEHKQQCLEMMDPLERLQLIASLVKVAR